MTNYERIKAMSVEEEVENGKMFDYEAPIKIIMQEMQAQLENQVYQAIQNIGVDVDKEELLKALSYDRNQYEKGYRAAKSEIVHCKDCKYLMFLDMYGEEMYDRLISTDLRADEIRKNYNDDKRNIKFTRDRKTLIEYQEGFNEDLLPCGHNDIYCSFKLIFVLI